MTHDEFTPQTYAVHLPEPGAADADVPNPPTIGINQGAPPQFSEFVPPNVQLSPVVTYHSPSQSRPVTRDEDYMGDSLTLAVQQDLASCRRLSRIWTIESLASGTPRSASDIGIDVAGSSAISGFSYDPSLAWPLQSTQEAELMRYFVENIASSFDLCDRGRHFALIVPQRAARCPMLLNALFAVSARNLSRCSDYNPLISNKYNQQCLKHLIPMLGDVNAITDDENLLAATVLLRHLEELDGKFPR